MEELDIQTEAKGDVEEFPFVFTSLALSNVQRWQFGMK